MWLWGGTSRAGVGVEVDVGDGAGTAGAGGGAGEVGAGGGCWSRRVSRWVRQEDMVMEQEEVVGSLLPSLPNMRH